MLVYPMCNVMQLASMVLLVLQTYKRSYANRARARIWNVFSTLERYK